MGSDHNTGKRITVFLSSTFSDLEGHRKKCIKVITDLRDEFGVDWLGMETFGADGHPPRDFCRQQVGRSDLYVGIVGTRYGYVDQETGVSATELEWHEAREHRIPCLIYIIDDNAEVPAGSMEKDPVSLVKLEAFKRSLRHFNDGHMVNRFSSEDHLAASLSVDLVKAIRMIREGSETADVKGSVEKAIADGVRFICEMENRVTGGWSYHDVLKGSSWDTSFSLLALSAARPSEVMACLHRGHQFLLSCRNSYGGWRSCWERNPDATTTMDTALALCALVGSGFEEQPWEIWRSADYLCSAQHPSGGWSYTFFDGPPVTAATAWAVTALIKVGWSPTTDVAQRAMHWLLENQRFDGGWDAEKGSLVSTIGKTRDALMALSVLRSDASDRAIEKGRSWLLQAREGCTSTEDFGRNIATYPQGVNPLVENIVLLLEGAFFAKIPPGHATIKSDLAWLTGRPLWSNTARAVTCMLQYRSWLR